MYSFNFHKTTNISIFSIIFVLLSILVIAATANAATFTVTRTDDRNATCNSGVDCSLREAVKASFTETTNDTIDFISGLTSITLTDEIAVISAGTLVINGPGANILTIDGGSGTNRIFYVNADVIIKGVTFTGGNGTGQQRSGYGGAIYALGGTLTLDSVHITGNSTPSGIGGGVTFDGGLDRLINSTISGNTANSCAGFANIANRVTIINSTISDNTAQDFGGGFCNNNNNSVTTLRNVTITNNTASEGGGIWIINGTMDFMNTIVAGNTASKGFPEIYKISKITSSGYNFVGDSLGDSANTNNSIDYQSTDILDTNPMLDMLQNYGGTTPTHSLLLGSPAINAGDNTNAPATDQRGFVRISGGIIDIGAFEVFTPKARKKIRFF
jgi:hypothetical protein